MFLLAVGRFGVDGSQRELSAGTHHIQSQAASREKVFTGLISVPLFLCCTLVLLVSNGYVGI